LIKGLRADTTYRFRVSAINQFGQSPYSWASIEIRTKKKGTCTFNLVFQQDWKNVGFLDKNV